MACRSRLMRVEGSLISGVWVRVGSSPDNVGTGRYCQTVRVRLTRREGETRVNQWLKPLKSTAGSNLVDMGRSATHTCHCVGGLVTQKPATVAGGEVTLNACGVGVTRLQGYSWSPSPSIGYVVNVGTLRDLPSRWPSQGDRRVGPLPIDGHSKGRRVRSTLSAGKLRAWGRDPASQRQRCGNGRRRW